MSYPALRWAIFALLLLPGIAQGASAPEDDSGYRAIMARDPVDPPDAPPDTLAFTSVHLQILACEITMGENGPRLPVFLNYTSDGSEARLHRFGDGEEVRVGQTEDVDFHSSIHGFELVATCRTHTVSCNSPNCLVLRHHDALQPFLDRHHIHRPYGRQLALDRILKPYLDAQGRIVLPDNERITLFELGTTDPANTAYDFQDLVVLVRLADAKPFQRGDF